MENIIELNEPSNLELLIGYRKNLLHYLKLTNAFNEAQNILLKYNIILNYYYEKDKFKLRYLFYQKKLNERSILVPSDIKYNFNYSKDILPLVLEILNYVKKRDLEWIINNKDIFDFGYIGFDNDYYFDNSIEKPSDLLIEKKSMLFKKIIKIISKKKQPF